MMTRRMFVKTASAFAGGAVFGMDFSAKANMKLAFQVYGVRDLCERDFASYAYLRPLLQQKMAEK